VGRLRCRLAFLLLGVAVVPGAAPPGSKRGDRCGRAAPADAWFDVLTSSTSVERLVAIAEAGLVELPLVVLLLLLARDATSALPPQSYFRISRTLSRA